MLPLRLLVPLVLLVAASGPSSRARAQGTEPASPRWAITTGAAPGYVDDAHCGTCHQDIARSYREVGMARSFARPGPGAYVEDFEDARYVHPASGNHYEMRRVGDGLVFKRWQVQADGTPIHVLEIEVAWIMGSGSRARSYLYRTADGMLFELPLGWYAQGRKWALSPGFEAPGDPGLMRPVRRECMFCHNAYPEVPRDSDLQHRPHVFPTRLPEGIGCQRCHGPGGEHVQRAREGEAALYARGMAILNPRDLPPGRRADVCAQCHLQPAVSLMGPRRFERAHYSFRPGERLTDYLVPTDVRTEGEERFEINHHAYRLEQSRCSLAGGGKLGCATCHDPHRKVPAGEREAHYRAACLTCHQPHPAPVPAAGVAAAAAGPLATAPAGGARPGEGQDCVGCHMPRRRTRDVVHVVMTDHRIQRTPGGPELLAPRAEAPPEISALRLHPREGNPTGPLGELYGMTALARALPTTPTADRVEALLEATPQVSVVPYLDLALARLRLGDPGRARTALRTALAKDAADPDALQILAATELRAGDFPAAEAILRRTLAASPEDFEALHNLGLLLQATGRDPEAVTVLEKAAARRFNSSRTWLALGTSRVRLGRTREAIEAFKVALAIRPDLARASAALGAALLAAGDEAEARRYLEHGHRVRARPGDEDEHLDRAVPAGPPTTR